MNEARIIGLSYHLAVSSGDAGGFFFCPQPEVLRHIEWLVCSPGCFLSPMSTWLAQSSAPIEG